MRITIEKSLGECWFMIEIVKMIFPLSLTCLMI